MPTVFAPDLINRCSPTTCWRDLPRAPPSTTGKTASSRRFRGAPGGEISAVAFAGGIWRLRHDLAEVCREQRRLAYRAPATALAVNMHLYWIGVAADLWRSGDTSLEWLLREAAAGEIFAAGHAESGNDIPVLLSTSKAERVDGGYSFTGRNSSAA